VLAARPQYGGTLRVAIAATIRSADPAAAPADATEAAARDRVLPLAFETLTRIDAASGLQPSLAASWESDARGARWRFRLRSGVTLHSGVPLESWQVAAALRARESRWTVSTDGDVVVVDLPEPAGDLPWRLADVGHAIVVRSPDGPMLGTGPFRVDRLDADALSLRSYDGYRSGRPFVDAVRIQMGRPASTQVSDLEAGRADLVSVHPLDARRLAARGMRLFASRPLELVAVVFEPHRATDAYLPIRQAFASALNRATMASVLLQQRADPAHALLPPWLSGYDLVTRRSETSSRASSNVVSGFSRTELNRAEQRELTLRVDASDALAQSIAERIAVDEREAGLSVKVQAAAGLAPRADARLVRIRLAADAPDRALAALVARLGPRATSDASPQTTVGAALAGIYRAESDLLARSVIVPVVHLPELYAASDQLASWASGPILPSGEWDFADLWLRTARP